MIQNFNMNLIWTLLFIALFETKKQVLLPLWVWKFQLHQKPYFRVSFSQFSLTKSQASKYPGKLWLTVAMICESSCDLMISPSRLFCISLGDKAYAKKQEKNTIHMFTWVFWQSSIRWKNDIIHQVSKFWHLKEINVTFYYNNYLLSFNFLKSEWP